MQLLAIQSHYKIGHRVYIFFKFPIYMMLSRFSFLLFILKRLARVQIQLIYITTKEIIFRMRSNSTSCKDARALALLLFRVSRLLNI